MKRTWQLLQPKLTVSAGLHRVSARVAGREVWFESTTPLRPAIEAFATALLIPALHRGRSIVPEGPLDRRWLEASRHVLPTLHRWWGYPQVHPVGVRAAGEAGGDATADEMVDDGAIPGASDPAGGAGSANVPPRSTDRYGLCFTCGADSFYSLLTRDPPPTDVVFAHGYDVPADDWPQRRTVKRSLRVVSRERGIRLHIIRTNLRSIDLFNKVNWERTHGAALAALGHLLGSEFSRLVIASSYRYDFAQPWGTSWLLDPHWSSSTMAIEHDDASTGRHPKLIHIAHQPLVQQHLRVCWRSPSSGGNCGRCEKCIRTMVSLQIAGMLDRMATFPQDRTLDELIDMLPTVPDNLVPVWSELNEQVRNVATHRAIERLQQRPATRPPRWHRLRKLWRRRGVIPRTAAPSRQ